MTMKTVAQSLADLRVPPAHVRVGSGPPREATSKPFRGSSTARPFFDVSWITSLSEHELHHAAFTRSFFDVEWSASFASRPRSKGKNGRAYSDMPSPSSQSAICSMRE
jgi:hypothetical protein